MAYQRRYLSRMKFLGLWLLISCFAAMGMKLTIFFSGWILRFFVIGYFSSSLYLGFFPWCFSSGPFWVPTPQFELKPLITFASLPWDIISDLHASCFGTRPGELATETGTLTLLKLFLFWDSLPRRPQLWRPRWGRHGRYHSRCALGCHFKQFHDKAAHRSSVDRFVTHSDSSLTLRVLWTKHSLSVGNLGICHLVWAEKHAWIPSVWLCFECPNSNLCWWAA